MIWEPAEEPSKIEWIASEEENLREVQRLGEAHMGAQLIRFQQGDQRGTSLLTVCSAAASALFGGGLALSQSTSASAYLSPAIFCGGATMLGAVFSALAAIHPVRFNIVGNTPQHFNKLELSEPLRALIATAANQCSDGIRANTEILTRRQCRLEYATYFAAATPILMLIVAIILLAIHNAPPGLIV